jgi:hypothetical protein
LKSEDAVEWMKVMRILRERSSLQIVITQRQLEYVEYFSYLGSMITNDLRCTREIEARIAMAKAEINRRLFSSANWTYILGRN